MRTAFLKTLEELAAEDGRINFLTGDLGFTVVEPFVKRFPKQFLNVGVAEQNMTGLAAGMALTGKVVFTYSIANFPTLRCLEQIRNDACYHKANVKVVSVGGGLAYGSLGSSHQATEDLAVMRALPGMTVVAPGDPVEAAYATRAVAGHEGPCYLRLGKAGEPVVHEGPIDFCLGRALTVREGRDLTVISIGGMLKPCADAAAALATEGIKVRLLSMHTLKPFDAEAVLKAVAETGGLLTVEEHSAVGGLGSATAEVLARSGLRTEFRSISLPDSFCREIGSHEYLRRFNGLTVEDIAKAAREMSRRAN